MVNSGSIDNSGIISAGPSLHGRPVGIRLEEHGGDITNSGTISGGIILRDGAIITNGSSRGSTALISGGIGTAVPGTTGTTITNFGTIASIDTAGGTAVSFDNASSVLVLEGGSRIVGEVRGAGSTLDLAAAGGAGTMTGLGSQYLNFASLVFDSGATWTAEGRTSGLPGTITGFDIGDVIDVDGFVAVSDSYGSSGLVLTDALGNSVTIGLQSSSPTRGFRIAADGRGGTIITVAPEGLTLSLASDSGTKGDNITNVPTPVITGKGDPGNTVTLLDGVMSIGTTTVDATGNWSVTTSALSVGKHILH